MASSAPPLYHPQLTPSPVRVPTRTCSTWRTFGRQILIQLLLSFLDRNRHRRHLKDLYRIVRQFGAFCLRIYQCDFLHFQVWYLWFSRVWLSFYRWRWQFGLRIRQRRLFLAPWIKQDITSPAVLPSAQTSSGQLFPLHFVW